ncbi:acyltransferase family protein [Microbacterium sp. NPDC055357]
MTFTAPATATTRYAGLDGLRAIAVGLVVVYHLFPPQLPGGFIGVDVFFVISGFLITTLLLREHAAAGRIRLRAFWRRRARRLLPALALVVTVCATAAWVIGGDVLVRLGAQVLGAFTFSYNWLSIAGGDGYFSAAAPELFRNFWSLAVEEQFYVLWPILLPLFLLIPRAWGRIVAVLALAAASAVWMGVVASTGGITRGYFGTDTHAFGILLGVALAFALFGVVHRARPTPADVTLADGWTVVQPRIAGRRMPSRAAVVTAVLGGASLIAIAALALVPPTMTAATFPGAVLAASLLSVIAIAAGIWPGSVFGPALDQPVLRWIGDRSYGIYLWHWPLLVLVVAGVQGTAPDAGFSPWIGVGVLALTLASAELSYRFVETPVRRHGFLGSFRMLLTRLRGTPAARLGALATIVAGTLVVGGTSAAIAMAPLTATGEDVVAAGAAALERAKEAPAPAATDAPTPAPPATPRPVAPLTAEPQPTVAPVVVTGDQVTAVGDSVMLASAPALLERLPGIHIDAAVSRSAWAGPGILETLAASGTLRPYVVIALGTNGPVDPSSLEGMAAAAGDDRLVVLVNAYAPRDWIPGVNADLAAFAQGRPNVVVADWSAAIADRTDLLAGDHVHPGTEGSRIFADVAAGTIEQVLQERAERRYSMKQRLYDDLTPPPSPRVRTD